MATAINTGGIRPVTLPPILAFIMGVPAAPREAIERTIEKAIEALDALDGDPDFEDGTDLEDDFAMTPRALARTGPGCAVSDPGEDGHDQEAVDEREPDHDAETETWSHWMDHAPETHIGARPGHNC